MALQVDDRTRSKWSRALRYAAEFKDLDEPLRDFHQAQGWYQQVRGAVCPAALEEIDRTSRSHGRCERPRHRHLPVIFSCRAAVSEATRLRRHYIT